MAFNMKMKALVALSLMAIWMIQVNVGDNSAEKMTASTITDSSDSTKEEGQIESLDEMQFQEFVESPSVRIVYFHTISKFSFKTCSCTICCVHVTESYCCHMLILNVDFFPYVLFQDTGQ